MKTKAVEQFKADLEQLAATKRDCGDADLLDVYAWHIDFARNLIRIQNEKPKEKNT